MHGRWLVVILGLGMSILFGAPGGVAQTADSSVASVEPEPPPPRQIPGVNAEDRFPDGCVSCHINMPDRKMDTRISTLMTQWNESVAPVARGAKGLSADLLSQEG